MSLVGCVIDDNLSYVFGGHDFCFHSLSRLMKTLCWVYIEKEFWSKPFLICQSKGAKLMHCAVVVVNYNNSADTIECLTSLNVNVSF